MHQRCIQQRYRVGGPPLASTLYPTAVSRRQRFLCNQGLAGVGVGGDAAVADGERLSSMAQSVFVLQFVIFVKKKFVESCGVYFVELLYVIIMPVELLYRNNSCPQIMIAVIIMPVELLYCNNYRVRGIIVR